MLQNLKKILQDLKEVITKYVDTSVFIFAFFVGCIFAASCTVIVISEIDCEADKKQLIDSFALTKRIMFLRQGDKPCEFLTDKNLLKQASLENCFFHGVFTNNKWLSFINIERYAQENTCAKVKEKLVDANHLKSAAETLKRIIFKVIRKNNNGGLHIQTTEELKETQLYALIGEDRKSKDLVSCTDKRNDKCESESPMKVKNIEGVTDDNEEKFAIALHDKVNAYLMFHDKHTISLNIKPK